MLNLEKFTNENLLSDLSAEAAANINGGQTDKGESRGKKYLQALGAAYLLPPGIERITDNEALLAQYIALRD